MEKIWIMTDGSKWEYPLIITSTAKKMAELTGYSVLTIRHAARDYEKGKIKKTKFVRMWIEDIEDEEWRVEDVQN